MKSANRFLEDYGAAKKVFLDSISKRRLLSEVFNRSSQAKNMLLVFIFVIFVIGFLSSVSGSMKEVGFPLMAASEVALVYLFLRMRASALGQKGEGGSGDLLPDSEHYTIFKDSLNESISHNIISEGNLEKVLGVVKKEVGVHENSLKLAKWVGYVLVAIILPTMLYLFKGWLISNIPDFFFVVVVGVLLVLLLLVAAFPVKTFSEKMRYFEIFLSVYLAERGFEDNP